MQHLPKQVRGKITHIVLRNKYTAVFEYNEHLILIMSIQANEALKDLSLRVEIRSLSGYSVGIAMINHFASMGNGEKKDYIF